MFIPFYLSELDPNRMYRKVYHLFIFHLESVFYNSFTDSHHSMRLVWFFCLSKRSLVSGNLCNFTSVYVLFEWCSRMCRQKKSRFNVYKREREKWLKLLQAPYAKNLRSQFPSFPQVWSVLPLASANISSSSPFLFRFTVSVVQQREDKVRRVGYYIILECGESTTKERQLERTCAATNVLASWSLGKKI